MLYAGVKGAGKDFVWVLGHGWSRWQTLRTRNSE